MTRSARLSLAFLPCALLLGVQASAVRADILVTGAGVTIETRGPWKVKGALVIFTRRDGVLASMRLTDVDLDASAKATAAAAQPAEKAAAATAPAKKPVLRLTDEDVSHVSGDEGKMEADKLAEEKKDPQAKTGVQIIDWTKGDAGETAGAVLTGSFQNFSRSVATSIRIEVKLYGADGKLIQSAPAVLSTDLLPPGERATFKATVPGVILYSAVKFDIKNDTIETNSPPPAGQPQG